MASLLGELKRRKVFQVAVTYAVVAWLIIQIVGEISEPLNLPDWLDTVVIVLLAAGFPVAVILAWVLDFTSAGVVRTASGLQEHAPDESENEQPAGQRGQRKRAGVADSVAVLPLENLSPDPDDAYFAAGIHEEILNYLAKVKGLSVIARTSVKKYANSDKSISEIAAELGVSAIVQGSVRYAGARVRVAAQLIDAQTDEHLWADVYERDLADVFVIQADIAANIAEALRARLSESDKELLESLPSTRSSEAHALYLESQALIGQGDVLYLTSPPSIRASIQSRLDRAIELDPNFAHPYALKALLCAISRIYDPVPQVDWTTRAEELDRSVRKHAETALALNANLALPYLALALNDQFNWRGQSAQKAYERAVELAPNDSNTLHWFSGLKWLQRELGDAISLSERAISLDPDNIPAQTFHGLILHSAGDHAGSVAAFDRAIALHPGSPHLYLHSAIPKLALGHRMQALERVRLADQLMPDAAVPALHSHVAYGYHCLDEDKDAKRVAEKMERIIDGRFIDPAVWTLNLLAKQEQGRALDRLKEAVERPESRHEIYVRGFIEENVWFDPVLEQPEFVSLRERLDLTG